MARRSSRRDVSHSASASHSSSNPTTVTRRSRTQASASNPVQQPLNSSRKRQPPPVNPPRPTKKSRNGKSLLWYFASQNDSHSIVSASNSQHAFRPPPINENSDSDDALSDPNSDKDEDGEEDNPDGDQGSDADDNLLALDDNEVQAALDLEVCLLSIFFPTDHVIQRYLGYPHAWR